MNETEQLIGVEVLVQKHFRRLSKVRGLGIVFVRKLIPQRQGRIPRPAHASRMKPEQVGARLLLNRRASSDKERIKPRLLDVFHTGCDPSCWQNAPLSKAGGQRVTRN